MSTQSTSNTHKNYYGKKKKKPMGSKKLRKIIQQEIDRNEEQEVELKYYDFSATSSVSASTNLINLSHVIPVGTDQSQRIGDKISAKSLLLRFNWIADDTSNILRLIIFRWFTEGTPFASEILESTATRVALQPLNLDYAPYIQVLYDNLWSVDSGDATTRGQALDKIFIKKNMNMTWTNTSITAQSGHLYMLFVSDSASGGGTLNYCARLRYTDQ